MKNILLGDEHPSVATSLATLGTLHQKMGRTDEALLKIGRLFLGIN